jgi:stringent starvation protein B
MDHGFTPYLSVAVDGSVGVPRQHVVNDEIVLNVSTDATGGLVLGDEYIEFKARFGGVPQQIVIPVGRVSAIYARENGQGMAFPVEPSVYVTENGQSDTSAAGGPADGAPDSPDGKSKIGSRPVLKRIK